MSSSIQMRSNKNNKESEMSANSTLNVSLNHYVSPDKASAEYFAYLAQAEINVAIKRQHAKIEMKALFF